MKINLKKNEERRIKIGHLWIFSNEIEFIDEEIIDGGVADLHSSRGEFLGRGFYNAHSLIAYRHLTNGNEEINEDFLLKRIKSAEQRRLKIFPDRKSFRLVNSESDFLPGLIIDKFENYFSLQIFSKGMENFKEVIAKILKENFDAEFIIEKNSNELRVLEGLEKTEKILFGDETAQEKIIEIDEIKYSVNLMEGQKTGFYLDQNFNRKKIRDYVSGNSSVLDLFCNEGGFALNAYFAGCRNIKGIDSSENSIARTKKNAELNGFEGIEFFAKDVFEFFDEEFQTKNKFNLIVLDPPSFTKSKKNIPTAVKGYIELNSKAMKLLHKNSFLFTYSCSHHISEKQFEEILVKSAELAKRKIQIIDFSNTTYDHPLLPQMAETKYLKGYILNVI